MRYDDCETFRETILSNKKTILMIFGTSKYGKKFLQLSVLQCSPEPRVIVRFEGDDIVNLYDSISEIFTHNEKYRKIVVNNPGDECRSIVKVGRVNASDDNILYFITIVSEVNNNTETISMNRTKFAALEKIISRCKKLLSKMSFRP